LLAKKVKEIQPEENKNNWNAKNRKGGLNLSRYNMDERLCRLGKGYTYARIIQELISKGIKVDASEISRAKDGLMQTPKADLILQEADKIISRWEAERKIG